jgi:prepilin-type processing-associated H-X9-DG protein
MNPSVNVGLKPFETSDLMLASYLRCRNFTIQDIKRHNGKTNFAFADSPQLRQAVLDYANDGPVAVRTFCGTMRDLKAITR